LNNSSVFPQAPLLFLGLVFPLLLTAFLKFTLKVYPFHRVNIYDLPKKSF
jgi:hypothetical protein